jgi:PAS domain S-box-containing protein
MAEDLTNASTSPKQLLNSIIDSAFFGIMAFRSVRDASSEIIDFEWIFANKTAASIVDLSIPQLMASRLLDVLPGNLDNGLFDKYKSVVKTGIPVSIEQHYQADNIDMWFQIKATKLEDGFTVTFQDISESKQAQAEIETKGKKYQKLFEESIDAIYLLDDQFKFLNVNSAFHELFSFTHSEILGSPVSKLFQKDEHYNDFEKALRAGEKVDELEVSLVTKKGVRKSCLINSVSIFDEEKQQINYLGVIRDMTKRKQAEQDIIRAEKLSMTGKIARTIAHEIRNPLTNLSLALDQLKEELPDEASDVELYLGIIERNSSRIEKLITDLLNSSKPKELKLHRQSINTLISETLTLVRDRLHLQEINLVEDYAKQDYQLPLDKDQFKIALLNLFINAIEAMVPSKGILQVATQKTNDHLLLSISDNGKGISEDDLRHLFEPFFTGKAEGTGLGLTTVQNIIHSHKGKINVESEIDKGTVFTLQFPWQNVEYLPQSKA